jgi:AraC-like DNA-binding protein
LEVLELFDFAQFRKDALSCYLETIQVADAAAKKSEFKSPWKSRAAQGSPAIYMVVSGSCLLKVGRKCKILMGAGDLAVLCHNKAHTLENIGRPVPFSKDKTLNPCEEATVMISLRFTWDGNGIAPLLPELPDAIHVKHEGGQLTHWIMNTLQLVNQQPLGENSGERDILRRIAHFFLIQGIRAQVAAMKPGNSRMLRAIVHGRIGPALYLLHTKPELQWSLPSLAKKCGICRSAFAREFRQAIGQPPMAYLTDRRMHRACELLGQGVMRIKEIALRSGYQSLPAFSSAFRKWAGVSAIDYRRSRLKKPGKEACAGLTGIHAIESDEIGIPSTKAEGTA